MKLSTRILAATAAALLSQGASANFNDGLPSGWTGSGNFGTSAANGVVTLAPGGGTQYGYVSTAGGVSGVSPFDFGGNRNGSVVRSNTFSALAGELLNFKFNYVTSDGAGYADYGWARLLNADLSQAALLFTARTTTSGNTAPGFGLPATDATVSASPIIAGAPSWSALASSSGTCYSAGCGYTGWISSAYTLAAAGNYILEFGVINFLDNGYQSGLAFDGITIGGDPISPVPEPESLAMLLAGLGIIAASARRRQQKLAKSA